MSRPRILVLGVTGFTGGLVARRLSGSDLPFVLTGRNEDRLRRTVRELTSHGERSEDGEPAPEARIVDVGRPEDLSSAIRPGDVIVNCAGPFTDLGEPVVRACVKAGAHYLDTTGEQVFMKTVEDRWHAPAREGGVAVVNAMAFEFALGDAAAALAGEKLKGPLRRIDVVYRWMPGGTSTSPGTRRSILRVVARPGWAYRQGSWRREPVARHRRSVRIPGAGTRTAVSFPAGEIVTVPRHLPVETVEGWIVTSRATATAARLFGPLLPHVTRLLFPALDRLAARGPEGPDAEEREGGFVIQAGAEGRDGERVRCVVEGRDPYGVTADIAVAAARRLLEPPPPATGVLSPVQVLEARALLNGLRGRGLRWSLEEGGVEGG